VHRPDLIDGLGVEAVEVSVTEQGVEGVAAAGSPDRGYRLQRAPSAPRFGSAVDGRLAGRHR